MKPDILKGLEGGEGLGDVGDYDDANAFGLDAYGSPMGLNPMWGAMIGSGVGTLTSVALRQFVKTKTLSTDKGVDLTEAVALGVAAVPSLAMIFWPGKAARAAGWTSLFAAVLNHGPRIAEAFLSDKEKVKTVAAIAAESATAPAGGGGGTQGARLGQVEIQQIPALAGANLGLVAPEMIKALGAPHEELPQLIGSPLAQAQREIQLLGGPQLSDLAGRFGSTHFNKQ
jgi:hypothetical protein